MFHDPRLESARTLADEIMAGRAAEDFTIGPGLEGSRTQHEQTFTLDIVSGAENVRRTRLPSQFFGRRELFPLFRPHFR